MIEYRNNTFFLDGKKLGTIQEKDGTLAFVSYRERSKHYFRKYRGWGVAKAILEKLDKMKITLIYIVLPDKSFSVLAHMFTQHGIKYKHEDFEEQLILDETFFTEHLEGASTKQQTLG